MWLWLCGVIIQPLGNVVDVSRCVESPPGTYIDSRVNPEYLDVACRSQLSSMA